VFFTSIAISSSGIPYVVYSDEGNGYGATVMKYDDTGWINVGNTDFSACIASYTSIAIDGGGTAYVAYEDGNDSQKATVMKYGFPNQVKNIPAQTSSLSLSPNPSTGLFNLHISSPQDETATIIITNMLGNKVKELKAAANIDVAVQLDASPGVYFVTAKTQNETVTEKVVVE
jgi:hypothetical protein